MLVCCNNTSDGYATLAEGSSFHSEHIGHSLKADVFADGGY